MSHRNPAGGPLVVVLAGRPGTGKTTLARRLAAHLGAAYLRIDAIETALVRSGLATHPVGPVGYVVAHELAAANIAVGRPVVIDAVNPVPEARAGWRGYAETAHVVVLETVVADEAEHRRRIEARRPDLDGQSVPNWAAVVDSDYVAWDERRDGPRTVVDMTDTEQGVALALTRVDSPRPVVAVCGPGGDAGADVLDSAREVGAGLARAGYVVATGGLDGVMTAAARGAREVGGVVIGILPGGDRAAGNEHLTVALAAGLGQARNAVLVAAADAVVAVGASAGTLSEVALAVRSGKPAVWVNGWRVGGNDAPDAAAIVAVSDAGEAVDAVRRALP